MYRYWHRHYTHTQALQRWLDLLRIRHIHSCSCFRDRHILTERNAHPQCSGTCGQTHAYNLTQFQMFISTQTNGVPTVQTHTCTEPHEQLQIDLDITQLLHAHTHAIQRQALHTLPHTHTHRVLQCDESCQPIPPGT